MASVSCPAVCMIAAGFSGQNLSQRSAVTSPHSTSANLVAQRVSRSVQAAERPSYLKWRAMADGGAPAPTAAAPAEAAPAEPEAPKPTMAKGNIVSVEKEKYLSSVEVTELPTDTCLFTACGTFPDVSQYKAVDHPVYFKGLDYIYEARGEVLDVRFFEAGEYCLIAWAGIPTAPAWLPAYMLVKEKVLKYTRT